MKSVEINYIYIGKKLDLLGGTMMKEWQKELVKKVFVTVVCTVVKEVVKNSLKS